MSRVNVLPDAKGTEIRDTQFNFVSGNLINQSKGVGGGTGLEILIQYCALNALVDSNERFDAPRCADETREAVIQEIDDWASNLDIDAAAMLWLRGGAGAGKSALAQTVAELYKRRRRLVGSFFFSRTAPGRSDGNALLPTLILQLTKAFPDIKHLIEKVLKGDPTLFSLSRTLQMQLLFIEPLQSIAAASISSSLFWFYLRQTLLFFLFTLQSILGPHVGAIPHGYTTLGPTSSSPPKPALIVIDGLDECSDAKIQCDLLRIIARAIPLLPATLPLRFLITSRPEAHITRSFYQDDALLGIRIHELDLSADRRAQDDIERFLRRGFMEVKRKHPYGQHLGENWPNYSDIFRLVRLSSGHFLFASTVLKYIQESDDFPDRRLAIVLGLVPSDDEALDDPSPFAPLDALYRQIFSELKPRHLSTVLAFFGILYLNNKSQLFNSNLPSLSRQIMDDMLGLKRGALEVVLLPLRSLVKLGPYEDELSERGDLNSKAVPMKNGFWNFHASLFDFLLDPVRSQQFLVDLRAVHHVVAEYFARCLLPAIPLYSGKSPEEYKVRAYAQFLRHCRLSEGCPDPNYKNTLLATSTPATILREHILMTGCIRYQDGLNFPLMIGDFLHVVSRPAAEHDPRGTIWIDHLRAIEMRIEEVRKTSKPLSDLLPKIRDVIRIPLAHNEGLSTESLLQIWREYNTNRSLTDDLEPTPIYQQLEHSQVFLHINSRKEWNRHFEIFLWGLTQWVPGVRPRLPKHSVEKCNAIVKAMHNLFLHLAAMQWHTFITPLSVSSTDRSLGLENVVILLESNASVNISLITFLNLPSSIDTGGRGDDYNFRVVLSHWEQSQWKQFTRPAGFLRDAEKHIMKCDDILLGKDTGGTVVHLTGRSNG